MDLDKYFSKLSKDQLKNFNSLIELYRAWNSKVNVISRKDIDNLYVNHILHSLSISKIHEFIDGTNILDVGTGGGLPGIPLAILFPKVNFTLLDSISKKIKVVEDIRKNLNLSNVITVNDRVENHDLKYDFVISRAVSKMDKFYLMVKNNIKSKSINSLPNGIISLKGGDLETELKQFNNFKVFEISKFFSDDFFQTKKIVYIPFPN
tara:strand:- start:108 stop:728 length:621 start_codon:yes stop_codon:yes gene_type:complete